jgi:hypothetical protein
MTIMISDIENKATMEAVVEVKMQMIVISNPPANQSLLAI